MIPQSQPVYHYFRHHSQVHHSAEAVDNLRIQVTSRAKFAFFATVMSSQRLKPRHTKPRHTKLRILRRLDGISECCIDRGN